MPELSADLQKTIMEWTANIAGAIVLLFTVWILGGWARRALVRVLVSSSFDVTLTKFFGNAARWSILLMGVLAVLSIFGVQTTSFAAVLGGAGLAIGMAFSGTLGNFASGILLLAFRPFTVGDTVTVAGVTGKVDEIGMFSTIMDTFDNRRLILPNNIIAGGIIENVTHHETRRVGVAVGTDYAADLDSTREVLELAARRVPGQVQDRASDVVLVELGASSVDWEVRLWVPTTDVFAAKQACTREIKKALDDAGIGIPFPQMDVHIDRDDAAPEEK